MEGIIDKATGGVYKLVKNIILIDIFPQMNAKGFKGFIPINNLDLVSSLKGIVETKTKKIVNGLTVCYDALHQMAAEGLLVEVWTDKHKPAKKSFVKAGWEKEEQVLGGTKTMQLCFFPPREQSEKAAESYRRGQEIADQFEYEE